MGRPSKALERFVQLYVSGPDHIRGQWAKCAYAAGMKEPPTRDDPMVRRKIEAAGGVVAQEDGVTPQHAQLGELERLLSDAETGAIPWRKLRAMLTPIIQSIAEGTVQARTAQVQMLRLIIEKAEKQAAEEEQVHGVVILPVQGTGASMTVDQLYLEKLKQLEEASEEAPSAQAQSGDSVATQSGPTNSLLGE